jgi:hypothetical protein
MTCPSDSNYVGAANQKSLGLGPKPMLDIRRAHSPSRRIWITNLDLDAVLAKGIFVDSQQWERALCQQTVSPAKQFGQLDSTIQIGLEAKPIARSLSMFLI